MRIEGSIPAYDLSHTLSREPVEIQAENRHIIQAVRAINASANLGDRNELVFSLDQQTRRPIIKIVNRTTNELVRQIPNEEVLVWAREFKNSADNR